MSQAMCNLSQPCFHDEDVAREYLERIRWANGIVCPHCGAIGEHYKIEANEKSKVRKGLYCCKDCREQFSVTVGTVFERSKIPLSKWLMAAFLMCASKKGYSSHQLHRTIGVTYKTAWFMTHRLRKAMESSHAGMLGGVGKTVEADETYWGNNRKKGTKKPRGGYENKEKIFSLVERGGNVRSFHVQSVNGATLKPILKAQVEQKTRIMTDEHGAYSGLKTHFEDHQVVKHSRKEYARGDVYTNTAENFFSILKRGLIGTFHHVGSQHLHRYIGEFDFRYNHRNISDLERTEKALTQIAGKRLLYSDSSVV